MATADQPQKHQQQQPIVERLEQLDNLLTANQIANLAVPIGNVCRLVLATWAGDQSAAREAKKICPSVAEFANAIGSLAVDCQRDGIGPDELAMQIQSVNASSIAKEANAFRNAFLDAYRSNFDQLKMALSKTTDSFAVGAYPKMVGMDWSILSVIESTEGAEIEEPLAEITFKTISPPGPSVDLAPAQFKFVCNKNQLQDFHWKVKEACNFIQKLASNEK